MQDQFLARRALMRMFSLGAVGVLVAGRLPSADAAAALVPLTSADPTAKSLGYVEDSSKVDAAANPMHQAGQKCGNCVQFQGKAGDARGACPIYPGKSVSVNGWCKVYARKPGS